jgi:hypothetical protein
MKKLLLTLFLMSGICYSQAVKFGTPTYQGTVVTLPVDFENIPPFGSISCKIWYDSDKYTLIDAVTDPSLLSIGWGMAGTDGMYLLYGWFSQGYSSAYSEHPFYFRLQQNKPGCSPLSWVVSPSDSFIGDIFSNEIPCDFENSTLCGQKVAPLPRAHWVNKYNILGQTY